MGKNVLVCDDAAFMRMIIKDILNKNGYNIVGEAENGRKAVDQYKELSPDLVLMDIAMPEMNGVEALKEIMKIDANANVVMCSVWGQQAMVDESARLGARGSVMKPFCPEDVIETLNKVIG